MKKFVSMLLVAVLLCSVVSVQAFAAAPSKTYGDMMGGKAIVWLEDVFKNEDNQAEADEIQKAAEEGNVMGYFDEATTAAALELAGIEADAVVCYEVLPIYAANIDFPDDYTATLEVPTQFKEEQKVVVLVGVLVNGVREWNVLAVDAKGGDLTMTFANKLLKQMEDRESVFVAISDAM